MEIEIARLEHDFSHIEDNEKNLRLPNRYDTEARPGDYWLVQRSGKQLKSAPHYTTSLDAALTLVPEGWGWSVGDIHPPSEAVPNSGKPWAEIWVRGPKRTPKLDGMWHSVEGRCGINAATPALALCIAALRARG